MPVRVATDGSPASVTLAADGAVPTELPAGEGKADVVVPWLAVKRLANPRWSGAGSSGGAVDAALKPLGEDERLVAFAGAVAQPTRAASMLFPNQKVVTVSLDLGRPLLSPAAAYEALDAVVLDAASAARVDESQLAVLLAGGATVAVRSGDKPGGDWPWKREGPYWVLRHDPLGPRGAVEEDAYLPTYGWVRGWPDSVRRQAVLFAAVFVIVAVGLTLWRSRYAAAAIIAVSLLGAGGVVAWGAGRSPVLSAGGAVAVWDGEFTQRDEWDYRTALRPADVTFPARDLSRPVLANPGQLKATGVRLVCTPAGQPDHFAARLDADHALAVLARSLKPGKPGGTPAMPATTPMYLVGDKLYPGKVTGQVVEEAPAAGHAWETVLLDAGGNRN